MNKVISFISCKALVLRKIYKEKGKKIFHEANIYMKQQ